MENVKKPLDYIQSAELETKCGALLTALSMDAIIKLMVDFARDYYELRQADNAFGKSLLTHNEFEQKTFGQNLLPKEEDNLNT